MFEPNAGVQEPNSSSHNLKMISTEPTEKCNHLPIYNQNIIAPGPSSSNCGTTEPGNFDLSTFFGNGQNIFDCDTLISLPWD